MDGYMYSPNVTKNFKNTQTMHLPQLPQVENLGKSQKIEIISKDGQFIEIMAQVKLTKLRAGS